VVGRDVQQVIAGVAPQARVLLFRHLGQAAPVLEIVRSTDQENCRRSAIDRDSLSMNRP
jgi:hypothetical protein